MIQALIFDCYDVLYVASGPEYFATLKAAHPARADELRDLGKQADYGYISLGDLARGIAEITGDDPQTVRRNLDGGHVRNAALVGLIEKLRPRYKTAIISNMSSESLSGIFTPGELRKLFDEVIISSQVGLLKPSPDIFLLAARRLGLDTSECLFVDDQPGNCDGARAVGMQAVEYKGYRRLLEDFKHNGIVV